MTSQKGRSCHFGFRFFWHRVLICAALLLAGSSASHAQFVPSETFAGTAFAKFFFVSPANIANFIVGHNLDAKKRDMADLCKKVGVTYQRLGWDPRPCTAVKWQARYRSPNGNPLIYAEFGRGKNTSLYLGGVHPDELTPVHLIFKFAEFLEQHPEVYERSDVRIVVAPLVNPDSFFSLDPPRVNHNGVDLNRNFLTSDWYEDAISAWKTRRKSDERYFPGHFPNSEIETLFQVDLIEEYLPGKIVSVHAPLGFLDYDGPGDQKPHKLSPIEQRAKDLIQKISEKSSNYKIVDYSFYPGSLGNFAGNERNIPTITLELETADAEKAESYWEKFRAGLVLSAQLPYLAEKKIPGNLKTGYLPQGRAKQAALAGTQPAKITKQ